MKFFKDNGNKGTEFKPIIFEKDETATMTINAVEERKSKDGVPMYVFKCKIIDGNHAGKNYSICAVVTHENKEGERKFTYSFKTVLRGFRDVITSLPKSTEEFNQYIPELLDRTITAGFFPVEKEGDYQGIMYIRDHGKNAAKENNEDIPTDEKTAPVF